MLNNFAFLPRHGSGTVKDVPGLHPVFVPVMAPVKTLFCGDEAVPTRGAGFLESTLAYLRCTGGLACETPDSLKDSIAKL